MNKTIAAALVATAMCGCITVNKNDGGEACLRPPTIKDVVHEKYSVGDSPVTATANAMGICGFIIIGDPEVTHWADATDDVRLPFKSSAAVAKNGAYSKACEQNGCDALVGTRYTVKKTSYVVFDKAVATVTGYPAKLEGVELIKAPCGKCPCPPPAK